MTKILSMISMNGKFEVHMTWFLIGWSVKPLYDGKEMYGQRFFFRRRKAQAYADQLAKNLSNVAFGGVEVIVNK